MAENKKSFTAYCDWNETFNALPDDKAGQLIKHLLAYVNDENPTTDDLLINAVFANIKATLKRDLVKWEAKSLKNKEIALTRWNKNNTNACERIKSDANYADSDSVSDSVSDSDSDSDSVSDILLKKETKEIFNFKKKLIEFGFSENLVNDWLKVRKNKKATNTETAYKKFIDQVLKTNAPPNNILELCVEKSWSGFNSDWYQNEKEKNQQAEKPLVGRMTKSVMESNFLKFANVKLPE